jgi:carbon-monoxide dehydrogenase small subunit
VLRDRLGVTGAQAGLRPRPLRRRARCGWTASCACACLVPAAAAEGADVETVAALRGPAGGLTDVQEAFVEAGATQCGYCTPGFVLAVTDLLERTPAPSRDEILAALYGNVCRCTATAGSSPRWRAGRRRRPRRPRGEP